MITTSASVRSSRHVNRMKFTNSWAMILRLREAKADPRLERNDFYFPNPWSSTQPQPMTALEPTRTVAAGHRPRGNQPGRWLPCSALTPREWLQLPANR
jgi:hypothetical protein